MTTRTAETSPRTYARIVGVLYLVIFILGPFAFFLGRTSVVVPGDPTATVNSLTASESMFRRQFECSCRVFRWAVCNHTDVCCHYTQVI